MPLCFRNGAVNHSPYALDKHVKKYLLPATSFEGEANEISVKKSRPLKPIINWDAAKGQKVIKIPSYSPFY